MILKVKLKKMLLYILKFIHFDLLHSWLYDSVIYYLNEKRNASKSDWDFTSNYFSSESKKGAKKLKVLNSALFIDSA